MPAIGTTALGIVMGWLIRYFIRRFEKFDATVLASVVSVLIGGAAVHFIAADPTTQWFYPVGLLAGFAIYSILAILERRFEWDPGVAALMEPTDKNIRY